MRQLIGITVGVVPDHLIAREGTVYAARDSVLQDVNLATGNTSTLLEVPDAGFSDMALRADTLYMVGTVAGQPA